MIRDWDAAYDNRGDVGHDFAEKFFANAARDALAFRDEMSAKGRARLDLAYGGLEREQFDLFAPQSAPRGLVIFVHGGFWRMFDKSVWSHLAEGALARGWAVAVPSYSLTPDVRVAEITRQIMRMVSCAAGMVDGPLRLAGHSAGGHLVSRMICQDIIFDPAIMARIDHVISISGLHDLRPMMNLALNETFRIDPAEADTESPALLLPQKGTSLTCWVGDAELAEFIRQNDLLANIWTGLGISTQAVYAPGKNHFTVIDDLKDSNSALCKLVAP